MLASVACAADDPSGAIGSASDGSSGTTVIAPTSDATPTSTSTSTSTGITTSNDDASATDSSSGATDPDDTGSTDPAWDAFADAREEMLEALAVPILDCVANVDTAHPVFHGCIDWHSAVHATYALHVVYRVTNDARYLVAAEAHLDPLALDEELDRVSAGQLPQEIPYGYAWFLALAIERETSTGATDLRPLALVIAQQLRTWLASRTPTQLYNGMLSDAYGNLSWTVLNLWRWAQHEADLELAADMEAFVADVVLDPVFDDACPLTQELVDIDDFFPPCLHRAMVITEIAATDQRGAWLSSQLPAEFDLVPLGPDDITSAHLGGLNFARAWGLWSLWRATADPVWRQRYVDHVQIHVDQPEFWAENYNAFAHWVAQFGVYAIARSYDDP